MSNGTQTPQPASQTPTPPNAAGELLGTIITFYSYKGGTGRSMSLANVAWILASAGNRVLAVDWDLEAPGLHRYFMPFLRDKKLTSTEGLIDFADEYKTKAMTPPPDGRPLAEDWYLAYANLSHYAVQLEWNFDGGGYIDFVPAGRQDDGYSALVNSFNWKTFFTELGGSRLLDVVKDRLRVDYDYILIDSRTGVSDTSGICTVKMPDVLVVCFTLNNQGIEGAASVANSVYQQRGPAIKIFPVPMRLDNGEKERQETRMAYAKEQFFQFPNDDSFGTKRQYWKDARVSYVPYYSFEEVLTPFAEKDEKNASMLDSAERLTAFLTTGQITKLTPPPERLRLKKLAEYEGREVEPTPPEKVSQAAQESFRRLKVEQQAAARRLLSRFVRVPRPEEKIDLTRRRVGISELGSDSHALTRALLEAQLIRVAGRDEDGEATFELVNEELLLDWMDLRTWVGDDRQFLLWRQQLHADLAAWQAAGRAPAKLLVGSALADALQWLKARRADLNDAEAEFINASDHAMRKQRLRRAFALAAFLLVLFLLPLTYYRFFPRTVIGPSAGERLTTEAGRRLDAALASPALNADDVQLTALLALEANRLAPSEEANAILKRALSMLPRRVATIKIDNDARNIAWSPDGKLVTVISGRAENVSQSSPATKEDRLVEVHEVATGRRVAEPIPFPSGLPDSTNPDAKNLANVQNYALSPDGRHVAFSRMMTSAGPYSVELLDVMSRQQKQMGTRKAPLYGIVFSPDSRWMITTGDEMTALLVDVTEARMLKELIHRGTVTGAAFSPDSKTVLTVSSDFFARLWGVSDPRGAPRRDFLNINGVATRVVFVSDGQRVLTLNSGNTYAQLWDLSSKEEKRRFEISSIIRDVAASPDGKFIAALGEDGSVSVWGVDDNDEPRRTNTGSGELNKLAFGSGDVKYLAAAVGSPVARVWMPPELGSPNLMMHNGNVTDIAFGPGGRTIATASADDTVRVWEIGDVASKPCERLARNLTQAEWRQFLPEESYRKSCEELGRDTP
ncbi:MAG: KGGVGR-motif variant AAA ATPase [Pyrinomonadaceae bacterium]